MPSKVEKHSPPDISYNSVVRGSSNVDRDREEILVLLSGDSLMEKRKCACLLNVRDFSTLPNIRMLCFDEGFEDFDICHVGGL